MNSTHAVLWILDVKCMLGGHTQRLGNTMLFMYLLFTSSLCVFILCKSEVIIKFL